MQFEFKHYRDSEVFVDVDFVQLWPVIIFSFPQQNEDKNTIIAQPACNVSCTCGDIQGFSSVCLCVSVWAEERLSAYEKHKETFHLIHSVYLLVRMHGFDFMESNV